MTIGLSSDSVTVGETITFRALEADEDSTYFWDFGDGSNETGAIVTHFYKKIGTFNISLSLVEDENVELDQTSVKVTNLKFYLPTPNIGDEAIYDIKCTFNVSFDIF